MAKLTINIIGDNSKALESIKIVEDRLKEVGKNPIKITLDASGIDAMSSQLKHVTEQTIRAAEAAAKLANAEARKINAQTRAAESAAKLAREQEKAAKAAEAAAQAQNNMASSTALVIQNVGTLEAKINNLTRAYTQLAQAQRMLGGGSGASGYLGSGGGGGVSTGNEGNALPAPGGLVPSSGRSVTWSRYGDYRDNAVDVDWTAVVNGANAAAGAVNNAGQAGKNATSGFRSLANMLKTTTQNSNGLVATLHQYIEWYLRWTLVSGAFQAGINSIRDALQTMKAVDDELVTVRKVTGFAEDQMKRVEEQAYKTASAYGVAANEYLESVASFARAGYKEQSAALAELATKTQIVGDTTADVANQFLLSVDAAYKYNGSIEDLTRVLDGANEIDNKYATSIEKIASGMGIVAPVAAQMHVGIDELAASIGTITAVTQRSGTEAARALRALFLNIAGDTKTEIDEGVTWTTGEIEGLRDVIKQYSKDAYDAAQATGSIINPMKAMEGLAKSMKEGALSEQKLIEMVSDIGGKLRTSQLLAIIQNWDMYQSMLQDYAGAIGSADKEVENALDSWSRKTAQLKNAWTEFISHLIETKQIKGAIDLLTGAVNLLDSAFGKAAVTAGLLFTALKVTGALNGLVALISGLVTTIGGLTTATELFNAVWAASPFMVVALGAAAIYGIVKAVDALTVTYDEQKETLEELETQYNKTYGAGSEYAELTKKKVDDLTAAEKRRLEVLKAAEAEEKKRIAEQRQQTYNTYRSENTTFAGGIVFDKTAMYVTSLNSGLTELAKKYNDAEMSDGEYRASLQQTVNSMRTTAEFLKELRDAGVELEDSDRRLIQIYDMLLDYLVRGSHNVRDNTAAIEENVAATETAADHQKLFAKAMEEVDSSSTLTYGTLEELEALYPGLSSRILDANGNLNAEGQAALSTRAAFTNLIGQMIAFNNTGLNVADKISQLQALARQAGVTGSAVLFAVGASQFKEAADAYVEIGYSRDEAEAAAFNDYYNYNWSKGVNDYFKSQDKITAPAGGGGGSTKTDPAQEYLNSLKQIVEDEKARYNLMEAQGASGAELAAQAKVIQEKLHDQAEQMREMGASYADVTALSTEWWTWQEKIAKLLEEDTVGPLKEVVDLEKQRLSYIKASGASEEEQIAQMRKVQASLKAQEAEMRRIGADEKDILAIATEWQNIENDIIDLQDKIAQQLRDEIAQTLSDIVDSLKDAEEAMLSPLQAQLDALNAAHDAAKERREEEEKIAAVQQRELELERARIALENAQRQRTVRQYNARSGQWEWVANAKDVEAAQKNVETAQKNLVDAQTALADYYADQAYETAKENLEKQISSTKSAFDALRDAMNEAAQAIKDGKMSYEEAYAYIKGKMQDIYNEYGVDLTGVLDTSITEFGKVNTKIKSLLQSLSKETQAAANQAMSNLDGTEDDINTGLGLFTLYMQNALKTNDPEKAIKELCDAINSGVVTDLHDVGTILNALNGQYAGISSDTAKLWALTKMQANSIAWHMTSDPNTQAALHNENVQLGTAIGLSYNSTTGTWHDASGQQVYTLNAVNGAWSSTLNDSALGGTGIVGTGGSSSGEVIDTTGGATFTQPNGNQIVIDPLTPEEQIRNESYSAAQKRVNGMSLDEYKSTKNSGSLGAGYGDGFEDDESTYAAMAWSSYGAYAHGIDKNSSAGKFITGVLAGEIEPGETLNARDGSMRYFMEALEDGGVLVKQGSSTIRFYDRGGILHGTGAIKATASDEMVLPPGMTSKMLNAEMTGAFDSLLRHLGIVTAAADSIAGFGGGITRNSIGEQHNGDVFYIDGIELKNITGSTTLNDLARCAKNLALQRGS